MCNAVLKYIIPYSIYLKILFVLSCDVLPQLFIQVVSESLNSLVNADGDASSPQDNTSHADVSSLSIKGQTTALSEHRPSSSVAAGSKTAADDVMVQIRARKSEVGLRQRFWQ